MNDLIIARVTDLPVEALEPLVAESEREGWRFVRRLVGEWTSAVNRFDQPNECLLLARQGESILGVCGLNADPYVTDKTIGRIRHLYVLEAYCRRGIGTQLIEAIVAAASGRFRTLRVRTENPGAVGVDRGSDLALVRAIISVPVQSDITYKYIGVQTRDGVDGAVIQDACAIACAGISTVKQIAKCRRKQRELEFKSLLKQSLGNDISPVKCQLMIGSKE
jgi:GNAT superfamily N-acetyltransferase